MDIRDYPGRRIQVLHPGTKWASNSCFGCDCCTNTGYSYICNRTGEKLEGYDSLEDKRRNINFLPKNILDGVGEKCPLIQVIPSRMTKIRLNVTLKYLESFIERKIFHGWVEIDDNHLILTMGWYDDGYESNRDYVSEDFNDVIDDVQRRFNVVVEEIDEDECYKANIFLKEE